MFFMNFTVQLRFQGLFLQGGTRALIRADDQEAMKPVFYKQIAGISWGRKCLLCLCGLYPAFAAHAMVLSGDESALPISIVLSQNAEPRVARVARELSFYLREIFGRPFPLRTGDESTGIILGTVEDYPQFKADLDREAPGAREGYLIRSESQRVFLIGVSPLGVQNAAWDFLYRLGYRHYFPGEKWEIIPRLKQADVSWDVVSFPFYATRSVGISAGTWPELAREYDIWKRHNLLDYGFVLHTTHEYGRIIKRHAEAFREHPEYLSGLAADEGKFVIADSGLRRLVIDDALELVRRQPERDSVSMEPSDGGGWPEWSPLGSVSDQVVTLANEVAEALQTEKPGTKVGILAYGEHSPPPNILVHPNVVVSVATGFIRGGFTFDELLTAWKARGATPGVYDYYGVWSWDNDLPGKSKASSPQRIADDLKMFYDAGVRYFFAEASYGWGPNGLGHYTAARCLWDINEARKVDAITEDFLEKAFGPAKEPMRQFYRIIDGQSSPLLSGHLLAGMYGTLQKAYAAAADDAVIARIDDLAAYTRFVELSYLVNASPDAQRQRAQDALREYVKSIRSLGMVHSRGMCSHLSKRDPDFPMPDASEYVAESAPTHRQFREWVDDGTKHYVSRPFDPRSFSQELVPLPGKDRQEAGDHTLAIRGQNTLFTYVSPGQSIRFSLQGGDIHGNRGPVRVQLFPVLEPLGKAVVNKKVPADKAKHEVILESDYEGLHRIEIQDGNDLTTLHWPSSLPLAIPSGLETSANLHRRHTLYFYVPKGTRTIGGYSDHPSGEVVAPDGRVAWRFSEMGAAGYFAVPVPEGQDQSVWMLEEFSGHKRLMTVPPYLALSPETLLLPVETLPGGQPVTQRQ